MGLLKILVVSIHLTCTGGLTIIKFSKSSNTHGNSTDLSAGGDITVVTRRGCAVSCSSSSSCSTFIYNRLASKCMTHGNKKKSNQSEAVDAKGWEVYESVSLEGRKLLTNTPTSMTSPSTTVSTTASTTTPASTTDSTVPESTTPTTPSTTPSKSKKVCENGGTLYNGYCYVVYSSTINWFQAKKNCKGIDSYLLELKSEEVQNFIDKYLAEKKDRCFWTGGNNLDNWRQWVWSESQDKFKYTHWNPGQPDGGLLSLELCLSIMPQSSLKWNNMKCAFEKCYYICEAKWNGKMVHTYDLIDCGKHGGKGFRDSCYVHFDERVKWRDAKKRCKSKNMNLVEISDKEENGFLIFYLKAKKVSKQESVWIGMSRRRRRDSLRWSSGKTMTFSYWSHGNPDGGTFFRPENCVEINIYGAYMWNDISCKAKKTYLCESRWEK